MGSMPSASERLPKCGLKSSNLLMTFQNLLLFITKETQQFLFILKCIITYELLWTCKIIVLKIEIHSDIYRLEIKKSNYIYGLFIQI